jgi:hypothetical protein
MRGRTVMLAGTLAFRPVKRAPRFAVAKAGLGKSRSRATKATTAAGDDGVDRSWGRRGLLFANMRVMRGEGKERGQAGEVQCRGSGEGSCLFVGCVEK